MFERELTLLIFAPATIGLLVMALRRTPPGVYWVSLVGVITLTLLRVLAQRPPMPGSIETEPMTLAILLVVFPTAAAFVAGRLVALSHGGAYVFTVTSSTYLFGLGLSALLGVFSRIIAF